MTDRWPCVTARCLLEDIGEPLPDPQSQRRADVDHPLVRELCRLAPTTPQGQKPILSLQSEGLFAFRVQYSQLRGCTWHDGNTEVVWLLASLLRKDGDPDDAYEEFSKLHAAGKLVPTQRDEVAAALERLFHDEVPRLAEKVVDAVETALANPDSKVDVAADALVPVTVRVEAIEVEDEGLAEIVVAFFRTNTLDHTVALALPTLVLDHAAAKLGLPRARDWEVGKGFAEFPQAAATYVTIVEFGDATFPVFGQ